MTERSGRFRVYRVVESVPHLNLQTTESPTLYTVYQSGYGDLQGAVDDLRTGDLVEATLEGDSTAEDEAWQLTDLDRVGGVAMDFAVDVDPPDVARDLWTPELTEPACAVLTEGDDPVGVCCVQPRDPLPNGAFVPNVLTGLLPLESMLTALPEIGESAAEALFLDPDPPGATTYSHPYGVVLLFTDSAASLPDRFRETYDCPRDGDTRPEFDPYGV
ncbi:hypothetical protein BRC79_10370 [Halobacteriales archaeon QH_8_67_27]|nr:MAG: hypothetical protein BRC79_10370 [Halobacteriales archaeon QH_8_67_27]